MLVEKKAWSLKKKLLVAGSVLTLTGIAIAWYLFTLTFDDTTTVKADFSVQADAFMKEFLADEKTANAKYTEKIISVAGLISSIEKADSSINIKMSDSTTGSYIIFALQPEQQVKAATLKEGDAVKIKGSCSGGTFSNILETESITFKRCVIE